MHVCVFFPLSFCVLPHPRIINEGCCGNIFYPGKGLARTRGADGGTKALSLV